MKLNTFCFLLFAFCLSGCIFAPDDEFNVYGLHDDHGLYDQDIGDIHSKWNSAKVQTRWQEYHGTMVRSQIMLDSGDLREMRLKLVPNADGGDINGDADYILEQVAAFEMGTVCGRNVKHVQVIYDNPTFEAIRSTPYSEYRIRSANIPLREYGFKCVYK
jgi:hypothetical protein